MSASRMLSCLLIVSLLGAARADVLVVALDGSGDFLTPQAAIEASSDGDVVLLTDPDYGLQGAGIVARSLLLIGDAGLRPKLGGLVIRNLGAAQSVVVQNVEVTSGLANSGLPAPTYVSNNVGKVLLENVLSRGRDGAQYLAIPLAGEAGMWISESAAVILQRVTVIGGDGRSSDEVPVLFPVVSAAAGGPGAWMRTSSVHASGSTFIGGHGGNEVVNDFPGGQGGHGVFGQSIDLWVEGCELTGGRGGDGCAAPGSGCVGGDGLELKVFVMTPNALRLRDATLSAGAGGMATGSGSGDPGVDLDAGGAAVVQLPGSARSTVVTSPRRAGEAGSITVSGEPGDLIAYLVGFDFMRLPLGGSKGALLVAPPLLKPLLFGAIPGSGERVIPFVAPSLLGSGIEHFADFSQCLILGADGKLLTSMSAFVHLGDTPATR